MKYIRLGEVPVTKVSHNPAIPKQTLLAYSEVPHVTNMARSVFPPGEVAEEHKHDDMTEIFTCHAGRGTIKINGTKYLLEPQVTVVVNAGELHEICNDGVEPLELTYIGVLT